MDRKQRQHELRKNDIAKMAEKACYEKGYLSLTMDDFAKYAGYTKKSLYNYFRSKEEIYAVVYNSGLKQRIDFITPEIEKKTTGIDKIKAFGLAYYQFYKQNPQILHHQLIADSKLVDMSTVEETLIERIAEVSNIGRTMLLDAFQLGIKDKSIREDLDISSAFFHTIYSLRAIASRAVEERIWDIAETNSAMNEDQWFNDFLMILINDYKM